MEQKKAIKKVVKTNVKKDIKTSVKTRILRNIFFVLAVSMFISTVVSYLYFTRIVRDQKIADEEDRMKQVSGQITFMAEDIKGFTRSIIVDDKIQEIVDNTDDDSLYENIKKRFDMNKRLNFYNSLRSYIRGSFIEINNGESYASSDNLDSDYLRRKTAIPEVQKYRKNPEWIFSNPYFGIDSWDSRQVVCYSGKMMDKYHFGKQKGLMTIEISLDYFLEPLKEYNQGFENICLIGSGDIILYEGNQKQPISKLLTENESYKKSGNFKVNHGYLICREIEGTGWKLVTLVTNEQLQESSRYVYQFFLFTFLFSILAIIITTSQLMEGITKPITHLSRQMQKTDYRELNPLEIVQTGDEIQILYECFNEMMEEIKQGIESRIEYEKQKKEMEFDIMLSQINPHFLYNVLNTVVYLANAGKNKEVTNIIKSMIYTMQETLNMGDRTLETTIENELDLTKAYLEIQKYRYPDRYDIHIKIDPELKEYKVPKTIIQPLVENAILHGILPMDKTGTIKIEVYQQESNLLIDVTDDGIGIADDRLEMFNKRAAIVYPTNGKGRKHIGISNIRDRIEYLYGDSCGMTIKQISTGGTSIHIKLPLKK